MKDISELPKSFDKFISDLKIKLVSAQKHANDFMLEDAKDRIEIPQEARNTQQFVAYSQSIKTKDPELKNGVIESSVYSDLLVGGQSKWADVPVGAFLEWGTGRLGEASNTYEHGYDYTTLQPWDYHTWLQYMQIGSWGIVARPHLYPAFLHTQNIFEENVKEAVEEAWNSKT